MKTILLILAIWTVLAFIFALFVGPWIAGACSDDEQVAEADQFMGWVS